jgi:PAS domain S-box-containing protein
MRTAFVVAAYVAAYVLLDWVSYIHPLGPFAITPWNPPPGLSVALLMAYGLRFWPALPAAGIAAEVLVRGWPSSPALALAATAIIAAGYTLASAFLRRRVRTAAELATVHGVAWFIGIVLVAALAVAGSYVAVHVAAGLIVPADVARSVVQFWVGDAVGILVTSPLALQLLARRGRVARGPVQRAEIAAQALAIATALWLVFGIGRDNAAKLFYVLFLPLIWISVRHGARGASFALVALQIGIVAGLQIRGYTAASVLEFQLFTAALAVTGLVLGAVVSERGRTRDELAAREMELATVFRTAPDGILVIGADGRVLSANAAAARMFGTTESGLAGIAFSQIVPAFDSGTAPLRRGERLARRRDGSTFPVELALGAAAEAAQPMTIGVLRDVTERKEMEEQLRERESELARSLRLAAGAETASSLAHELNQPLSAIGSYVRACTLMLERPEEHRARLEQTMNTVVAEVTRAGEVVRRLREFFRSGTSRLEQARAGALIEAGIRPLAQRLTRHGIALSVELAPDLPEVSVDRLQIETVLHNLVANAVDAIVAAAAPERSIAIRAARAGPALRITVADSGPGLPAGMTEQAFRPFATTKPHGMGLGLAISRSIVENHGGRLVVERTERGAAFSFTLPVDSAQEAV